MNLKSIAGVLSFANLTNRAKPMASAAAVEPTEQTQENGDASAVDTLEPSSAEATPETAAAEVPSDKQTDQGENGGNDTDPGMNATPAAAAEASPEDDDEAEMRGASAEAKARERERARCLAIFESAGAARNPVLAASLAFGTSLTRAQAIATLDAMPEPANPVTQSRAARNPNLGNGGDPHVHPAQAQAAGWDRAFKQATTR